MTLWYWITAPEYTLGIMFVKWPFSYSMSGSSAVQSFKIACFVVMGMVAAYSLAGLFSVLFACIPIQKYWDITITTGHRRVNISKLSFAGTMLNTITKSYHLLPPGAHGVKASSQDEAEAWTGSGLYDRRMMEVGPQSIQATMTSMKSSQERPISTLRSFL